MIIHTRAYARAGLIGNPSDGYFGKTISIITKNFYAEAILFESPELEIELHKSDLTIFSGIEELVGSVRFSGYYGGIRLIKAAIKRFHDYCRAERLSIDFKRNFTIRYNSNIPLRVGLAGSSAIITATIRALMKFYQVDIPKPILANLILSVENEELRIPAGLQDRVIQVYEGLVYMDFNREFMEDYGYGKYDELDTKLLPPLYLAYMHELSEGTEVFHSDIKERFWKGDPKVVQAMKTFADLTDRFRRALDKGDVKTMSSLMDLNFDTRASIYQISEMNWKLINTARNCGASAKFTGSGGAIIGIYEGERMFKELEQGLNAIGAKVVKPIY